MGFLWVTGFSFFHCVASPFHSFVTTYVYATTSVVYTEKKERARIGQERNQHKRKSEKVKPTHSVL